MGDRDSGMIVGKQINKQTNKLINKTHLNMKTFGQKGLTTAKVIKDMTHTKTSPIYLFPCSDCGKKILTGHCLIFFSLIHPGSAPCK